MVDVAQVVEPRIVIPVVVGSSPIVHPKNWKRSPRAPFFSFAARTPLLPIPVRRPRHGAASVERSGRRPESAAALFWKLLAAHDEYLSFAARSIDPGEV